MARVRVHNFTITLDGFGAGVNQRLEEPFGDGVDGLHDWMIKAWEDKANGKKTGIDVERVDAWEEGTGATIMGRNMFGPVRGGWDEGWAGGNRGEEWLGWWGEDPPFHHDVFVLTHHARDPVPMAGGTTFHFVTDGIEAALERAREAAGTGDVRVGGGAATVQQYLRAGLLDELHLVVVPVLLGSGERLFEGLGDALDGWACVEFAPSRSVSHVRLRRGPADFDTMEA